MRADRSLEVGLQRLPVVPPRLAVDARGRVSLQCEVRCPQTVDVVDVVQQRGESLRPVPFCCLTYPLDAIRRLYPALGPVVVTVRRVPLGTARFPPPPPLPVPRRCSAASSVLRGVSDFPRSFIIGVRP